MNQQYRVYFVTCEGKSEENYLQRLNQFLKEERVGCSFKIVGKGMGGGAIVNTLKRKHRSRRYERTDSRFFLLDRDRILRGELDIRQVEKIDFQARVWLNTQNFEDFLALHSNAGILGMCISCMQRENHYTSPLHSAQYMPLYVHFFPEYTKGDLPVDFCFKSALCNLRLNYPKVKESTGATDENEFAHFMMENILPLLKNKVESADNQGAE